MNLPGDVLIEILSRLPVQSLHRFRCVSKLFNCLISDPHFQNKQLRHAESPNNLESRKILARLLDEDLLVSCSLDSAYNNAISWRRNYSSDNERKDSVFVRALCPSINGLFCVCLGPPLGCYSSFETCLWNPTINELRRLPYSSLYFSVKRREEESVYGFGYDSVNDDYVVVRLIIKLRNVLEKGSIKVEVYSLKNDSWRLIQPFPYSVIYEGTYFNCQFVNSRFHWMVQRDEGPVLVSLKLSNYEYEDIPQPNYQKVPHIFHDDVDVLVQDGLLYVYCNYFQRYFDLWTMKDYGVQQSWMMILSIPQYDILGTLDLDTSLGYVFVLVLPLYLFENGDVLFELDTQCKQEIMVYKKDKKLFKPTFVRITHLRAGSKIYTETLISPNRHITPAALRIAKHLMGVSRDRLIQYVS